MTGPVEIALVGCGAIARRGYLPALSRVPEVRCRWLMDLQRDRAERLARQYGIPHITDNFSSVLDSVEAVILAIPNHLHAPMALEALERGRAVLCEKPLARTNAEALRMVETSRKAGVTLVAGMIFRQYPGLGQIQAEFPWEVLGKIREIRASYGTTLDWPVSSSHLFDREKAGGGVLVDKGSHVLDSLLWVMSSREASVDEYRDDGDSGVEAEARARLSLRLPVDRDTAPCLLEVSHIRRLENRIVVVGEHASLLMPLSSVAFPFFRVNGGDRPALAGAVAPRNGIDCFAEQIKAFAQRLRGLDASCVDAESQLPVLEIIDSCYGVRQPLAFPWQAYAPWN